MAARLEPDPPPAVVAGGAGVATDAWPEGGTGLTSSDPAEQHMWDADRAVTEVFRTHYRTMVRLAALLTGDASRAEEVVQDAFVELHARWTRLRDTGKAVAYLRQCVVNGCRSQLRHRVVVNQFVAAQPEPPLAPSAELGAMDLLTHSRVIEALRALPQRQREALILRYYLDLSEAEIALAMRVSRGAVKSHAARGIAALRETLGGAS